MNIVEENNNSYKKNFNTLRAKFPDFKFIQIEQAEIVTFRHKALAAPSVVKMEKQSLLTIKLTYY